MRFAKLNKLPLSFEPPSPLSPPPSKVLEKGLGLGLHHVPTAVTRVTADRPQNYVQGLRTRVVYKFSCARRIVMLVILVKPSKHVW